MNKNKAGLFFAFVFLGSVDCGAGPTRAAPGIAAPKIEAQDQNKAKKRKPGDGIVEDKLSIRTINEHNGKITVHLKLSQIDADKIAVKLERLEKNRPRSLRDGGSEAELDRWAKEWRDLNNKLGESFYRYRSGKNAEKMSSEEIQGILQHEVQFDGKYY